MPGLKEVRTRIASVNTTKQVTSAMKMVAAAKLRKAQTAILKLRPYSNKLSELISEISASVEASSDVVYFKKRKPEKILVVVVSSNRGLCGAFNSNIIKTAVQHLEAHYSEQHHNGNVHLITIGKKVSDFFAKKKNYTIIETYDHIFDDLTYNKTSEFAEKLMNFYASETYDRIEIIYNQFKNAVSQILTVEQFLPIEQTNLQKAKKSNNIDYIFEPEKTEMLAELVPKSLKIRIFKIILDSWASEQGARMTAMQKATDNADELLRELRLSYNKARQAAITKEIIEIVSGVNALKG